MIGFQADFSNKTILNYCKNNTNSLSALCDKYGSDKGSLMSEGHVYDWYPHSYTDYYYSIFNHCRNSICKVFECGIGTNDPEIDSSMGIRGNPGASLRVWKDYFPNAKIYGADIDRNILFNSERIYTYYVDQLDVASVQNMWLEINETNFDIIIDDGLHTSEAGISLFTNSISYLSEIGIYIIEDVKKDQYDNYLQFFDSSLYHVEYINLFRKDSELYDNSLIIIRKISQLTL